MKNLLIFLLTCLAVWLISCGGDENPVVQPPTSTADSIRCAQAWQKFQLPNDTILTLRYQQPVKLVNGLDTMAITVINIDDLCSEQSAKDTYGCEALIYLKIQLNGGCIYQTKYPLNIARYGSGDEGPHTITFKDFDCNVHYSNDPIINGPSDGILAFYNSAIFFRKLLPFAKTQVELTRLSTDKQQYTITLWLKKRCF